MIIFLENLHECVFWSRNVNLQFYFLMSYSRSATINMKYQIFFWKNANVGQTRHIWIFNPKKHRKCGRDSTDCCLNMLLIRNIRISKNRNVVSRACISRRESIYAYIRITDMFYVCAFHHEIEIKQKHCHLNDFWEWWLSFCKLKHEIVPIFAVIRVTLIKNRPFLVDYCIWTTTAELI